MRKIIIILITSLLVHTMYAGYGYSSNCGASVTINGKTLNFGSCTSSTDFFNAYNFNVIGALTLEKAVQKTFENGADNVSTATLYYIIYPANGTNPGTYQPINLTTITNNGNGEEQRDANPGANLFINLTMNTAYKIEMYLESTLTNGTTFKLNNNGANFIANFKTPLLLPVDYTYFTLNAQSDHNLLRFGTGTENTLSKFIILRSNNGNNFVEIGSVNAANSANGNSYTFKDEKPLNGNNFYRIICVNLQGEKTYSKIVRNFWGKIDNSLSLFPNPTVDYLKVNFVSSVKGKYKLTMYNDAGQNLYSQDFTYNGADRTISLDLPKSMKKGPYRIHITNGSDFYIGTFIVQ